MFRSASARTIAPPFRIPRAPALTLTLTLAALGLAAPARAATPGWRLLDVPETGSYALRYLPFSLPADVPLPVVVFLHGSGATPQQWQPQLGPAADAAGVVLLVPKSVSDLGFGPGDDAATIAAALADLAADLPVDPERIALAGHSSGGAYAGVLGLSPGFRASALFLLGAPYRIVLARAEPAVAPPVRMVYGSLDPNFTGGHAGAWQEQWARLGLASTLIVNPGAGHSDWPPATLPDAFAFLRDARHATAAGCAPSDTRLCLAGGRFAVEAAWAAPDQGTAGPAHAAAPRTGDAGLLWFFRPDNWEIQVKVLDACAVNGHFWVFAAATTNVETTLTVTDLAHPERVVTYHKEAGPPAPAVTDTAAFPCP